MATIDQVTLRSLERERAAKAKLAFTTRRVPVENMRTLIGGMARPAPGDLVLARVDAIGKHARLELRDGRRAYMFLGDEIVVCFGNRYAPDQFEAVVGDDLGSCDLVAGGGIAARELSRHARMVEPTRITPVGLIGDSAGHQLNVRDYAIPFNNTECRIAVVLVAGTSMNAGKTLTAASLIRGLKAAGHRVAAIKATGTGSGGDLWIMRDVGADVVLDFTDAGFASTYKTPPDRIELATLGLLDHAAREGCEFAVVEIADGLQQHETAALLRSRPLRRRSLGVLFAAYDAMGAKAGVDALVDIGHRVLAVSGKLTRSPLAIREAEQATGCHIVTPQDLQEGVLLQAIVEQAGAGRGRHPTEPVAVNGFAPGTFSDNGDTSRFRREILRYVADRLMELEIDGLCGADRGKRRRDRTNRRNGYRPRRWETSTGTIGLNIPRLRSGGYLPAFIVPGTAAQEALLAAVREFQIIGVSTRAVQEMLNALGIAGVHSERVLRLRENIEAYAEGLRNRDIEFAAVRSNRGDMWSKFGYDEIDDDEENDFDGVEYLEEIVDNPHMSTFGGGGT